MNVWELSIGRKYIALVENLLSYMIMFVQLVYLQLIKLGLV